MRAVADAKAGDHLVSPFAPASHVRYQVLAVACSLALLTYVHRLGFVVGNPQIKQGLHLDDEQMGYLASAFLLAYALFQVPGGLLGDLLGGRHLLTILVLGWSLLTAAVALTASLAAAPLLAFGVLFGLRFLFGMFQAGGFPALARVQADWMPLKERASAQGLVWTCSRLGGAVVPFLFLWLFQLFGTWTTPFWIIGLLGVLWCAAFWPWFRNRPEEMKGVNDAERELIAAGRSFQVAPGGALLVPWSSRPPEIKGVDAAEAGSIMPEPSIPVKPGNTPADPLSGVTEPKIGVELRNRPRAPWSIMLSALSVWSLCLMYGCVGFGGNFMTTLLPLYLRDHRHLSDETTMLLSALPLAFGIGSCLLGGLLSDWIIRRFGSRKWGRRLNGSIGLLLAGAAYLAIPWVHNLWLLGFVLSAAFFLNDLNMGPSWAAAADIGERYAGTLSGAMNMVGSLFGAVGMAFAGRYFKQGNDELVFIVFACSYGLAALCWLGVNAAKPLLSRPL
jgi:sugar phosphate permease